MDLWTFGRAAAVLLLLGNLLIFPGLMMFWMRRGHQGGAPPTHAYYVWERVFILASIIPTAIGFLLLEGQLQGTAGILARVGAAAYLMAGLCGVIAEVLDLARENNYVYPLVVVYVITAFLGQAVIGGALLTSGMIAGWIGGLMIVWNLAWLVLLPLLTPRDIYFPVLHHAMPLVIGIALLIR